MVANGDNVSVPEFFTCRCIDNVGWGKKPGGRLTLQKAFFNVVCSPPAPGPDLKGCVLGAFQDV